MGTFRVQIEVAASGSERFQPIEALVDTGATYLVVPAPVLESLGVPPTSERTFDLADGRRVTYSLGFVDLRWEGEIVSVPCVFGDANSVSLLGAVPLEILSVAPDPVHQRLVHVDALMMRQAESLITREQVEHVAMLARLGLTEDEKMTLQAQLSSILEYMRALSQVDTSAIPPTAQVIPLRNVMRDDEPAPSLPVEEALANAPEREGDFIKFPPVLE